MPLNRAPLVLDPAPKSVREARRWVADVLAQLGRDELVNSAEQGVSELVTNAILHADPPIAVRVRGTRDHPRVEVRDHSPHPPVLNPGMAEPDNLLSTIGRGLGIVALYSTVWGSEVAPDGKTVWFEPCSDTDPAGDLSQDVFDFAQFVEGRVASAPRPGRLLTVRLRNMPVSLFAASRVRYAELGRELRLLAITHGEEYPLAKELSELFVQVETERQQANGIEQIDEAIAAGMDHMDLEYEVPSSSSRTMPLLLEMLERADEFCRDQKLLTLSASPLQRALQRWYLGEFARQAAGEEPIAWSESLTLEEDLAPR